MADDASALFCCYLYPAGAAASFKPATSALNTGANPAAAAVQAPAAAAAAALPNNRLLLASHGRLMWYFPESDEYMVLHEGEVGGVSHLVIICVVWVSFCQK
jgi:hypothetical protein